MPRWSKSAIESFFADNRVSIREPCEVVIDGGRIAVSQVYEGVGPVTYSGQEIEPGHFTVRADRVSGSGSLHKFANSNRLEGYWVENRGQGMWRIDLSDGEDD